MGGVLSVYSNTVGLVRGLYWGAHSLKSEGESPAVTRTNVGVPAVALLNQDTIQYAFNPELYEKGPPDSEFGFAGIADDLVRGHCPSMFTKDKEHRRKKAFLVDTFEKCRKTLPSVLRAQVLAHFEEWPRLEAVPDFEDRVYYVISEALTEAVFGKKVDGRLCYTWVSGLPEVKMPMWIPIPSMASRHRLALEALPTLFKAIEETPKYEELAQLCRTHDLEVEDGIFTLLYATLFNGCGATRSAIVTTVACLHTISDAEKNHIRQTTLQVLEKHGDFSKEAVGEMKTLESFILEVLRLHPPVFNFWGVARKDFVISAEKENVQVRKGERLFGSCFWAQRDGSVFPDPDLFQWDRFLDEEEGGGQRKHLLFPRGSWTEAASLDSHQCPGQDIAFTMVKATLAVLLCYCSWELEDTPVWSDKTERLGSPDALVSLARFNFNSEEARRVLGVEELPTQRVEETGTMFSSDSSTIDAVITVRTGDVKGGGTDGNVYIALHDIKGNRTRDVLLDCRWKNDFEAGNLDTFEITDAKLSYDLKEIEIWRDNFLKMDDWFVEVVTVELAGKPKFVFPVQRWVNAGERLYLTQYDSCLPQFEQHPEQRTRLLNAKRQLYQYQQKAEGLPVQIKELPGDEHFSSGYRFDILKKKVLLLAESKIVNMTTDNWESLEDLQNVYQYNLGPPKGMAYWKEDLNFGEQRLMGCNPNIFKLCREIPENFGVTAEMLEPFLEGLSLKDALGSKRLYMVDLTFLEGTECADNRQICAPYALLFVIKDKDLMPVAIQLFPVKGPDNPVFLPSDPPYTWLMAKIWYNMADCSFHQSCTHLGLTHLIAESSAICTNRQLSASHPIFRLMAPHFLYLLAINTLALEKLVSPGGWIDQTMQVGRTGLFHIVKKVWKDWRMDVHGTLPAELENRGVDDVKALPNYPYRDDALPIWHAINRYVRKVVEATYDVPAKIAEDHELQAWARELSAPQADGGCEIKGVPGDGKFTTVDEIVATVTPIIFICSVGHAAANFGQYDEYAFPPNYPAFLHGEPPKTKDPLTEQDIISALPNKSHTLDIMVVTKILSERATQALGDFERQYMFDPLGVKAWEEFRQELDAISKESTERDKARKNSYPYLNPKEIPNAISI